MAGVPQEMPPPLFLVVRPKVSAIAVDPAFQVFQERGFVAMGIQEGLRKKTVATQMILMGMRGDQIVHRHLPLDGQEFFPITGGVDDDLDLVFDEKRMAKRIAFASDQLNRSLDEIKQVISVHGD